MGFLRREGRKLESVEKVITCCEGILTIFLVAELRRREKHGSKTLSRAQHSALSKISGHYSTMSFRRAGWEQGATTIYSRRGSCRCGRTTGTRMGGR